MIIIFAGCDCTGKSTCFNLMNKSSYAAYKGSANSDPKGALFRLKYDLMLNIRAIHDRIPLIDDFVYSQIFSGKPSELMSEVNEIKRVLKKCLVFYFDCDNQIIAKRMEERGDDYISASQIPEIKIAYKKTFNLLDIKPVVIDTTHLSPEEVKEKVEEVINEQKLEGR